MPTLEPLRFKEGLRLNEWTLVTGGKFTSWVWKGQHDDGRTGVAKAARGKKPIWGTRFVHEVATLEQLQTAPGVLRLLDRDESPSPRWMVTELAESLADHLGPAPELGSVVSAFADIAETLTDAGLRGISHRDIKPDNLFFARGRSVVGDFGLATGHDSPGLTGHGDRVGPANYCAPEALSAHDDIDWSAADVYALAKSFWAILAEEKYPPQGPMYVRRPECGLGRFGGRAGEDLARLLEIATEENPSFRPTLSELRDELRHWLQIYPAGSTRRPLANYPNVLEEARSVAAVDAGGRSTIVDDAVHRLLDGCRKAGPDSGQIVADPKADIVPSGDPRIYDDPEWVPECDAVKKLSWDVVGGIRLVAVGVVEGDELRYRLSWQRRRPGTASWEVTWQADGRAMARLPSDVAVRLRLTDEAMRQRPKALSDPTSIASRDTEDALRRVATGIRRREVTRKRDVEEARHRAKTREAAISRAKEDLDSIWEELTQYVNSAVEHDIEIRTHSRDDDWILTLGDRRIIIFAGFPPEHLESSLLLGTVTIEMRDEGEVHYKTEIANVCAVADSSGDPIWQLLRFRRNDFANPPVRVAEALFDTCGAIPHKVLDELLHTDFRGAHHPPATLVSRDPLTVDVLMRFAGSELEAMDRFGGSETRQSDE